MGAMMNSEMFELNLEEIGFVGGGVFWDGVAQGLALVAVGAFALAAAPETGGLSLAAAAAISVGGHLAVFSAAS